MDIPQWVIDYDKANYNSSAGKAVRILMNKVKELECVISSTPKEPETVQGNETEEGVIVGTYYCRFCDAKFTDEYDLEAHVNFHHLRRQLTPNY